MFKVFDKVNNWFVCDGDGDTAIYTKAEAELCIKCGVMMYNANRTMNHRWTKNDFEIIPC